MSTRNGTFKRIRLKSPTRPVPVTANNIPMSSRHNTSILPSIVDTASPSCPFEEFQIEIHFHILSFLDFQASPLVKENIPIYLKRLLQNYGSISKSTLKFALLYLQMNPIIGYDNFETPYVLDFLLWCIRNKVAFQKFVVGHDMSMRAMHLHQYLITNCNFAKLQEFKTLSKPDVGPQSLFMDLTHNNMLESQHLPLNILNADYTLHDAIVQSLGVKQQPVLKSLLVNLKIEVYHRPILDTFCHTLEKLELFLCHSLSIKETDAFYTGLNDICTAISKMTKLKELEITVFGNPKHFLQQVNYPLDIKSNSLETFVLKQANVNILECPNLKQCHLVNDVDDGNVRIKETDDISCDDDNICELKYGQVKGDLHGTFRVPNECMFHIELERDPDFSDDDDDSDDGIPFPVQLLFNALRDF